ncbi:NAD(P)-dependent oxidoreductase [Candidatus Micrarchaeota archaeon]|nr:NAD(P)-dependent oxidoreductase [Candidatus Micrarchaeota archaeon]
MKVLVTGGSGYIGQRLLRALSIEHEVTLLDRHPVEGISFIEADIRDQGLNISTFDVIYHLAAVSSPRLMDKDRELAWDVNVNGTRNIASSLKKGQHLIFMSSAQVYDKRSRKKHMENEMPFPNNYYGLSKLVGEEIVRYLSFQKGFSCAILRLFNVYSEDQSPGLLVGDVMEKYRKGGAVEVFNPRSVLDMVHMDDLISTLKFAPSIPSGTYNVCSGHPISVGEIYSAARIFVGAEKGREVVVSDKEDFLLGDNKKLLDLGMRFRDFSLVK